MQDSEIWLTRWHSAGLLDDASAAAIRAYEEGHAKPTSRRWQVLIALILGAILLGAGVLLFVAAHWDGVSPLARLLLVLAMLASNCQIASNHDPLFAFNRDPFDARGFGLSM